MHLPNMITQPLKVLNQAINRVPFVKYALGIAGIGGAIAIIKAFNIQNFNVPLLSLLIFLGLMVLLFVFSALTRSNDRYLKFAGYMLVYTVTIATCISAIFLVTSIFFKYPDKFENLVSLKKGDELEHLTVEDLLIEGSLTKSDSSLQSLTPEEINEYVKIYPPVNKSGKDENLAIKFELPSKYKQKDFIGIQFHFGSSVYANMSGNLLTPDNWNSFPLDSDNRYFVSEPLAFPDKLVFKIIYKTPNK